MNTFLLYILRSGACLALLYIAWRALMGHSANFRLSRRLLLAIVLTAMAIPLLPIPDSLTVASLLGNAEQPPTPLQLPTIIMETSREMASPVSTTTAAATVAESRVTPPDAGISGFMIPVYIIGLFVSLLATLTAIAAVLRIIRRARRETFNGRQIWVSPDINSSFTFAGEIVLSDDDFRCFAFEVITHETSHLTSKHFVDLCLLELTGIVQWFNPFAWLLKRDVKALHEYEADRQTLQQGIDAAYYQRMLIEKAAGSGRYALVNSFSKSKIKQRIEMMNRTLKPQSAWRTMLFIPLAGLLLTAFANPVTVDSDSSDTAQLSPTPLPAQTTGAQTPPQTDTLQSPDQKIRLICVSETGDTITDKITTMSQLVNNRDDRNIYVMVSKKGDRDGMATITRWQLSDETIAKIQAKAGAVTEATPGTATTTHNAADKEALIIINGKEATSAELSALSADDIESITVLKDADAIKKYGSKATNGVVEVTTKSAAKKAPADNKTAKAEAQNDTTFTYPLIILDNKLLLLDNKEVTSDILMAVGEANLEAFTILKGDEATKKYGDKGTNGAIEISSKDAAVTQKLMDEIVKASSGQTTSTNAYYIHPPKGKPILHIIDGKGTDSIGSLKSADVKSITVIKGPAATKMYGDKGVNGVIVITTKGAEQ
ncbi:MAG: TonB-dependent receptor plug domain-containing protein [Bacteroidales bacterium]|jgi:TonB-dependent SusC/RagA subfamily outer membrane receptor|nr:TonB-dependent receptor plug domain-containing protein [Bacteroidales bacterium]